MQAASLQHNVGKIVVNLFCCTELSGLLHCELHHAVSNDVMAHITAFLFLYALTQSSVMTSLLTATGIHINYENIDPKNLELFSL